MPAGKNDDTLILEVKNGEGEERWKIFKLPDMVKIKLW